MEWTPPPRLVALTALGIHRGLSTRVPGPQPPADAVARRGLDQAWRPGSVAAWNGQVIGAKAAVVVAPPPPRPDAVASSTGVAGPVQPSEAPPPHLLRAGVSQDAASVEAPPTPPQAVRSVRPRLPPVLPRTLADTAVVGALAAELVSSQARFQRAEAAAAEAWAEAVVLHARLLHHEPSVVGEHRIAAGHPEALALEMERRGLLARQAGLLQRFLEEAAEADPGPP